MIKKIPLLFIVIALFAGTVVAQDEFIFTHYNAANTPAFSGNNFKTVAVSRTGQVWAGSQYQGLKRYDPATDTWYASPDLTNVFCADIKANRLEGVWIAQAGTSGQSGGGSNIAGGVNTYPGLDFSNMSFYSITSGGGLTSRNARSIWLDKYHNSPDGKQRVWVAQGTYITSSTTTAGGISVGLNLSQNYFNKVYQGLQVTPYVSAGNAGTPNCLSVAGNRNEVWVFAATNFGRSQILRYRSEGTPGTFLGAYDYTNTPQLNSGFRANAMYFDDEDRAWIGMNSGGIVVQSGGVWTAMNDTAVFPAGVIVNANAITSDQNGYVYIGTSAGLVIYRSGPYDSASSYKRVTTADGLPSNNINGIAVDTVAKRIILAHDAGITFMKYNKKVEATLEWDYSFPKPDIQPKGVVADGTSRLFINVHRATNNLNPIKKIELGIKGVLNGVNSLLGKLKVADVISQYSNEANTGTSTLVSRTDSTPQGNFYFWYVAPDDFSKDSLSREANLSEREDTVKVKVTYNDNSTDSMDLPIKIQRPPVVFSGMFGGIKSILDKMNLPGGVPLLDGDKIGKILKLQMSQTADLLSNISRLLDGDQLQNDDKDNSVQGLLENVRNTGFAANKVNFVAHGIAGNVLRAAIAAKPDKYNADGNYKYNNYGKGFVNKFISVDVPHNGTPIFDLVRTMLPKMNEISTKILATMAKKDPVQLTLPYMMMVLKDSLLLPAQQMLEKASIDSAIMKLPVTNIKNHLLVTDANATAEKLEQEQVYSGGHGFLGSFLSNLTMVLRDQSPLFLKDSLTGLFSGINSEVARIVKGVDIFADLKGFPNFIGDGDLVVPVSSQAAGQTGGLFSNITKVTGDLLNKLMHDSILANPFVVDKIKQLLNTSVLNNVFGNSIPANNLPTTLDNLVLKASKLFYDTTKVVTDDRDVLNNSDFRQMQGGGGRTLSILADTFVRVRFRVKDTAKLQYVFINFQDTMYTTTSKQRDQEIMLKVKKDFLYAGLQELTAVGVYETADSVIYHADTVNTYVMAPDSVQGFRLTAESFNLYDGIPYYPSYEVKVKGEWQALPGSEPAIGISFEDPGKAAYDTGRHAFDATADGFTRVYFTYKSFRDTIAFNCLLPQSLTAVNRTVVNGDFKDSGTWSKGRPPLPGDSIIISAGHNIVLDSTVQVRSLRIDSLGTLTLSNAAMLLQLGDAEDGDFMVDNYGTLNISNGTLTVKGRVKLNRGSRFNMTGGMLVIDGNTGNTVTSLQNGLFLFEAAPQMQSFSFTGGTLQIIDPPIGVASQAINCPYNFGIASTLILGNGVSLTAGNSPGGFGGSLFPPQIGRLILDAGTTSGNRQLTISRPLSVKGSFEIRTGSNVVMQAPVTVTQ